MGTVLAVLLGIDSLVAQVVQLPTIHQFSVRTSVIAPDRGSAYLGGIARASLGNANYGVPVFSLLPSVQRLFGRRFASSSFGRAGASVHATVIDLAAMDRAVLASAAARDALRPRDPRAVAIENQLRATSESDRATGAAVRSVADIQKENRRRKIAVGREGQELFSKGIAAETAGKTGTARIYYQMALRRVDAATQRRVHARLQSLGARK